MKKFFKIFLVIHILLLSISCEKEEEIKPTVNFTIFFQAECMSEMVFICVSEDEFMRIKKLHALDEGVDKSCFSITVTDLDGKKYEGILRGYSSTSEDIPCDQSVF
ncbi:hypothetical protein [Cellulophaga baltica]|uniref:hypothetical protein n=1 Tax=Cellulophaga baltica TaxID=76594 RepID=UPI0024946D3D|nr:hypothetical protein [Cellulophaga baltica]